MSVPEEKRRQGKMAVVLKAQQLAKYTNEIFANTRKFDPIFKEILGDKIISLGQNIFIYCKLANGIRVTKPVTNEIIPRNRIRRKEYQDKAIDQCEILEGYIDMAHDSYHMSAKRTAYWTKLTVETKMYIKKWQAADNKRYDSS